MIAQRTELGASGADGASLGFEPARFVEITRPTFVAARQGVAWVVTQGRFALWRVELDGQVLFESLVGIPDLGGSTIVDVDVISDRATGAAVLYTLVRDGTFDWRLFRRASVGEGAATWQLVASADLTEWPAEVVALTVADSGTVYLAASEPAGLFRLIPSLARVRDWVPNLPVLGIDTAADDSLQLYAAPQTDPGDAARQVGVFSDGNRGVWRSQYDPCPTAFSLGQAPPSMQVPNFPRDVALVDARRAMLVDSLNHVVRVQTLDGGGQVVFGVPCEDGADARHLQNPRGAALDEQGNVFISDTANNRVVILAAR